MISETVEEEPEPPTQKRSALLPPTRGRTLLSDLLKHQPWPSPNKQRFVRCVYCSQEIKPKETKQLKGLGP